VSVGKALYKGNFYSGSDKKRGPFLLLRQDEAGGDTVAGNRLPID